MGLSDRSICKLDLECVMNLLDLRTLTFYTLREMGIGEPSIHRIYAFLHPVARFLTDAGYPDLVEVRV